MTSPDAPRFILLTPFVDYDFFDPIKKGAADAARSLGVSAEFGGVPDGDIGELAKRVREAAQAGYDGIAVNIVNSAGLAAAVQETIDDGVPVIAFNVDDQRTPTGRLAAIGQNMQAAGRCLAHALESQIPERSSILLTCHDENISALEERAASIREALSAKSIAWKTLVTGTQMDRAVERVRDALAADQSIRIAIGTGAADTETTGRAVERHFPKQGYLCAGFDLSPQILRLIKAGILHGSIDQQPYIQGYFSVLQLTLLHRYDIRPVSIDTGAVLVTSDDIDRLKQLSRQLYR